MTTFSSFVHSQRRAPACSVVLEPWAFRDDWSAKPGEPVAVGIRLIGDMEKTQARIDAAKFSRSAHEEQDVELAVDAYNDALMRQMAAKALCDPNDVTRPVELLQFPEDDVERALTSRGARFIFEAVCRYEVESSPLNPEADQDDIEELSDLLLLNAIESLPSARQLAARKLARYLLDELRSTQSDELTLGG